MWSAKFHTHLAVRALKQGKVIAYPTESVFGLGCDPNNLSAIKRLLQIKSRSASKGLILIASDISQLEPWVEFQQVPDMQKILDSWPGHETWLVPARKHVPTLLTGNHETLAIRITAHPTVCQLCQSFNGAITSTSANKNGLPETLDIFSTRQLFNDEIDYYLPGRITGSQKPSRIRDAMTGELIRAK